MKRSFSSRVARLSKTPIRFLLFLLLSTSKESRRLIFVRGKPADHRVAPVARDRAGPAAVAVRFEGILSKLNHGRITPGMNGQRTF